ncbi:methyl-accepting chemotaxis protein [Hydrogenophaga sp. OTU3427]|uniref:methyl-accepting chemotaxis protein n=1 Tax=Hydrogenophaga sp. OTU3427 TaxID=3043856 RepID=UPI00313EB39D
MNRLRDLLGRRDPLDDIPLSDGMSSEIMDPASGLSSSTFGSDSILSVPSGVGQAGAGAATKASEVVIDDAVHMPLLGRRSVEAHQRILVAGLTVLLLLTGLLLAYQWYGARDDGGARAAPLVAALLDTQRVAQLAGQAVAGEAAAFARLKAADQALQRGLASLALLDDSLPEHAKRIDAAVGVVLAQEAALVRLPAQLAELRQRSGTQLDAAEAWLAQLALQNAPAADVAASAQLARLLHRVRFTAVGFATPTGTSAPAVIALGQDVNAIQERLDAVLAAARRVPPRDTRQREPLEQLQRDQAGVLAAANALLTTVQEVGPPREAQRQLLRDSEPLMGRLLALQGRVGLAPVEPTGGLVAPALTAVGALLCLWGLAQLQLRVSRRRQGTAEQLQTLASSQEREARRINDATQAAILRLMNELQDVADGDLTKQATVTEDITGAIADSINYTVEELRNLVGQVQTSAERVGQTTASVENTSIELLAASTEQLREIRETGQAVLDMAQRIQQVSAQAQTSSEVARQSAQAAESGLQAVLASMGGMNQIRDQIQDTAKRIKRLGESSQEIGEITELISSITEQTNVLALNAAIQAASAGEAGRGFSVVAEEVQRLAERSADATRQIAALVKAIQGDTQDTILAMESSTRGVVEGARLSDNAGAALTEIDRYSRQVAELVGQIAESTAREAQLAGGTADNIQHIFAVTEQTGEGTRSTVQQVRELTRIADELKQSVARFRIA